MSSRTIRRLADAFGLLNRGRFAERCDAALNEAIQTLEALPSEKGKAVITMTFTLAYDGGSLQLLPAIKSKLPDEQAFAATTFWVHDGGLSLQHPSQIDMFVRGVDDTAETGRDTA